MKKQNNSRSLNRYLLLPNLYQVRLIFFLITLLLLSIAFPVSVAALDVREAIVKVYTVSNSPDYYNPWSMRGPQGVSGSGCIIENNLILTNAHVVSDHTFLQVRKYGDTERYQAQVIAVSHLTDLALLEVEDPAFFEGEPALLFGELPETQQEVLVYGFPMGGDMLSITKGIISRIEHQPYVHSSSSFLAGQIDAAINPGNSGGPVLVDDKIVGVVMQGISSSQNIGYMVPVPVIRHFFDDLQDGSYDGYPSLGVSLQDMENPDLREYYQMEEGMSGVLINQIIPGSPADEYLQASDILLSLGDYAIGNDGTIEFRTNERTQLTYVIQQNQIGENIRMEILREGKKISLDLNLFRSLKKDQLVPMEEYETLPSYYIYSGFVFCPLSKNLLDIWGSQWYQSAPKELIYPLLNSNIPEQEDQQVVVLLKALAANVNQGYQNVNSWVVEKVNGEKIWNLNELIEKVESSLDPYIVFEDKWGQQIVVDREKAENTHQEILETYRIPFDRSEDLRKARL
jgi:S1-C subfamily serine protease